MARDKNNQHHTYCWEFQESLVKYGNGNWFGRLIAFEGEVRISGNSYSQEDIDDLFENSNIKIIKIETDFDNVSFTKTDPTNPDKYQHGIIRSQVEMELVVNGVTINDTFTVTHQVKPAFQSKLSVVS